MTQIKEKRKRVWTYLNSSEKQTLTEMAEAANQSLSEHIRVKLTRRTNKIQLSPHVIADRILLSKVKQSTMIIRAIAQGSSDTENMEKIFKELDKLVNTIDPAILRLIGVEDDSSNLSEK